MIRVYGIYCFQITSSSKPLQTPNAMFPFSLNFHQNSKKGPMDEFLVRYLLDLPTELIGFTMGIGAFSRISRPSVRELMLSDAVVAHHFYSLGTC